MVRPKVKICGIKSLEDARFCAAAGADFLGFIQHRPSPRNISPDLCRDIIEWIHGARPVGVFVNESASTVNAVVAATGFEFVQAHGLETPDWCASIDVPVVKAIQVGPGATSDSLRFRMDPYVPFVTAFLLDTRDADLPGGSGRVFDWSLAEGLSTEFPLFLAGGLSPDNVIEAVDRVAPYGIDLSSRLEEAPGRKDFGRVAALFEALETRFGSSE